MDTSVANKPAFFASLYTILTIIVDFYLKFIVFSSLNIRKSYDQPSGNKAVLVFVCLQANAVDGFQNCKLMLNASDAVTWNIMKLNFN
jgi:hypothetical protein